MGTKPSRQGYLPINGLNLYHEVYGELNTSKSPLLLIPGAFMAIDSMTAWTDAFAQERAVIVFDQQGHGCTPDTSRTMSYEQFADDAAALLRALEVERADVMGYSQGGGVALQLAIRHPSLVASWSRCRLPSARTAGIRRCPKPSGDSAPKRSRVRPSRSVQGAHAGRCGLRCLPREDEDAECQRPGHQRRSDAFDLREDDGHRR